MEEPPQNYQSAEDRLLARGGSLVCPVCSGSAWVAPGTLANMLGNLPLVTDGDEHILIHDVDGIQVGHVCYAFICANCGFVRLHSKDALSRDLSGG
jgi:hypothetical protein